MGPDLSSGTDIIMFQGLKDGKIIDQKSLGPEV
jgi:hypothetical protein